MPDPTAALVIAAVTAALRDRLANGLIQYSSATKLGDVNVSVLPPDRITVGAEEPNQLNLFMYRVAAHSALRKSSARSTRTDNSPAGQLGLDLHYLLTAYGAQDFHSEVLLGCAVHLLSGVSVLTPACYGGPSPALKLKEKSMSPVRAALAASVQHHGFNGASISQEFMSFEDMSKLWSVLQARYRPSVTYEVSAVTMAIDR
jgi:Pvc16 N-terminal domain